MRVLLKSLIVLLFTFPVLSNDANRDWITRAEEYLNSHQNWHAEFIQKKGGEPLKTGSIWISRPGLLRLDYISPEKEHLYINNGWATYTIPRFHEVTNIPLDTTPAGFFLKKKICLTIGVSVQGVSFDGDEVVMRVVEAKDPNKGMVLLIFNKEPFHLKGWVVVDSVKNVTHIELTTRLKKHTKNKKWFIEETSINKLKLRD